MTKMIPIETEVGIMQGRDCIFLDKVSLPNTSTLKLKGGINGNLCSKGIDDKEYSYTLTFKGIIALKITELESSNTSGTSSFDECIKSKWLGEISEGDKFTNKHKHYFLQTYDDVFEVICDNFLFEINTNA